MLCFHDVENMSLRPSGLVVNVYSAKIVSEYDQEILQSQTADKPMALQGTAFDRFFISWKHNVLFSFIFHQNANTT